MKLQLLRFISVTIITLISWVLTSCSDDKFDPDPIPVFPPVFQYGEEEVEASIEGEVVDIVSNMANSPELKLFYIADEQVIDENTLPYFKEGKVGNDMSLTQYFSSKCNFVSVNDFIEDEVCGELPDNGKATIPIGNYAVKFYRSSKDGKNHIQVTMPKLDSKNPAQVCLYFFDKDMEVGVLTIYQWERNK